MKTTLRNLSLSLLAVLILAFPTVAHAAGSPRLELAAQPARPRVGEIFTVEVRARGVPPVYGADVLVTFDPRALEVVDIDASQEGVQFAPGDFIDPDQSFVLRHAVDNAGGSVAYVLALLNPAPEARGNGTLMTITFRARASGTTTVSIASGAFGTRAGDTLAAGLDAIEVRVNDHPLHGAISTPTLLIAGASSLGLAVGGVILFRRRRI